MEETGRQRGDIAGDLATAGGVGSSGPGPTQTHAVTRSKWKPPVSISRSIL